MRTTIFRKTALVGVLALTTALGMTASGAYGVSRGSSDHAVTVSAHTAKKTITCYKGNAVKKVTGANPKCPVGWTTKKPALKSINCYKGTTVKVVKAAAPSCPAGYSTKKPAAASKVRAFNGTYKGTIAMLWSASEVKVTQLTGTGTGSVFGLTSVSGTGSSSPSSTCDPISGTGTLRGAAGSLTLKLATTSQGCGADSSAPTLVTVTGSAVVLSGTGTFAGATGSLKVAGSFSIKSTTAGSSESDGFTATLSGNLTVK
jgi:hypothetical protein